MLTLFSYPDLFGVADNNPYGLKVFAFLKLCGLEFRHVHIIDTKAAPRGQLPYIDDDGEILGDSDRMPRKYPRPFCSGRFHSCFTSAYTSTGTITQIMKINIPTAFGALIECPPSVVTA